MVPSMDFKEQFEKDVKALEERQAEINSKLAAEGDIPAEDVKALKAEFESASERIASLEADRAAEEAKLERKALVDQIEGQDARLKKLAEGKGLSAADFRLGASTEIAEEIYGEDGGKGWFNDLLGARTGDMEARSRIMEAASEGKAMGEGTDTAGGFLVPPALSNELITIRDVGSVLRPLFSSTSVEVEALRFIAQDNGLAVAWTAEFAEKIESEFEFSEFEVHVYTAAGLAVASNQLLADSRWPLDRMIFADLAKRFIFLEETAFLAGTGVGQPLGIINTPGVQSVPYTGTANQQNLMDKVEEAITDVYTEYKAPPTAIVMHPRTWGYIARGRESTSPSTYLIGAGSTAFGRRGNDPLPGFGSGALPRGELFGFPVYTTPSVPTTLGTGTNESVVFVGDFSQGLVLDRQGITNDVSPHVYFTSNQTVFRSEERLGFTAGRYPKAFAVVQGDALAGV